RTPGRGGRLSASLATAHANTNRDVRSRIPCDECVIRVEGARDTPKSRDADLHRNSDQSVYNLAEAATHERHLHFEFCILNYCITAEQAQYPPQCSATSAA